jgi:hypothetical protein
MRYLINKYGHDENKFYGFESKLSFQKLLQKLEAKIEAGSKGGRPFDFQFQGYTFVNFDPNFEVIDLMSLEMFWLQSTVRGKTI